MTPERRSLALGRAGAVAWLLAVWLLLWGRVTPMLVLGGLVAALVLTVGVRLPQVKLRLRPRPWLILVAVGRLVADISRSTAALVRTVVTSGPATRSALVRLPIEARDEGMAVFVASWVSLTPGSLVVDIDDEHREVIVHIVPARDADAARREALDAGRRVLRALGGELR